LFNYFIAISLYKAVTLITAVNDCNILTGIFLGIRVFRTVRTIRVVV